MLRYVAVISAEEGSFIFLLPKKKVILVVLKIDIYFSLELKLF